ncbi:MAG: CubicO group peptidase (beta-lactamase class C family) [Candidatus Paceibacteria bacterium]|jgi:CubicO group peptidase (beta-lactamase class C family)
MFRHILLATLALSAPLLAQDTSPEALNQVRGLFERWNDFGQPGMAVGIIHDGDLVFAEGFGMANLEVGSENGPEVLYRIGSTSKQFTATAISLLALDGKLELDAPLNKYLPTFVDYKPPVTVRQLVNHTSGLPDYINIQFSQGGGGKAWFTPKQTLAVLSTADLEFTPGSRYAYSNSNYFLMGELVQRASGKSLRDFARERIFNPLGMDDTRFHDRHDEVIEGRSHGYSRQTESGRGEWKVDITHLDHVGDGGVFTTIEDLAKWDANFYGNKLGHGQALLDLLHRQGVLNDGETIAYASGLNIGSNRGLRTVTHGGSWVGYLAAMDRYPDQRFTVIVLANQTSANPAQLSRQVADICLKGLFTE